MNILMNFSFPYNKLKQGQIIDDFVINLIKLYLFEILTSMILIY